MMGRIDVMEITIGFLANWFATEGLNVLKNMTVERIKNARKARTDEKSNTESQVYNVVINVLNKMTNNRYKNEQDKIYDVAEKVIHRFISSIDENKKSEVNSILREVCSSSVHDLSDIFLHTFIREISKDEHRELYCTLSYSLLNNNSKILSEVNNNVGIMSKKIDALSKSVNNENTGINCKITTAKSEETGDTSMTNADKKKYYIDNWNSKLFLQPSDSNITLAKAFVTPNYKIIKCIKQLDSTRKGSIKITIRNFVDCAKTRNLLITGFPGIGKSSIVSWIAKKYRYDNRIIVLRFRDWEKYDLEKGLMSAVCNSLKYDNKNKLENKVLVLDGFDEINSMVDRLDILEDFMAKAEDVENLKYIIMSRPGYIQSGKFQNAIELLPFDKFKIRIFNRIITGNKIEQDKIVNEDVLGIPVILYMAIMSGIDIESKLTVPQMYTRIFSIHGGIFDRFAESGIGDGKPYSDGLHIFRKDNNKEKYIRFLKQLACSFFIKDDLEIWIDKTDIPMLEINNEKVSILEFPIRQLPSEKEDKICLEFIHKSIYEFFLSEYVYERISAYVGNENSEDLAGTLGEILGTQEFPSEAASYLADRIISSGIRDNIFNDAFSLMLSNGMTYYSTNKMPSILKNEAVCFNNMLVLIGYCFDEKNKFIPSDKNKFIAYFMYVAANNRIVYLKLVDLSKTEINGGMFLHVALISVDLSNSTIKDTRIYQSEFENVNLDNTLFERVDFIDVDFHLLKMDETYFQHCKLYNGQIINSNFKSVTFDKSRIEHMVFKSPIIEKIIMKHSNVKDTKISNGKKAQANLKKTILDEETYKTFHKELEIDSTDLMIERKYMSPTASSRRKYYKK